MKKEAVKNFFVFLQPCFLGYRKKGAESVNFAPTNFCRWFPNGVQRYSKGEIGI